jgi:outer membrane protein assembly factor BamB
MMASALLHRAILVFLGCAVSFSAVSVSAGEDGKAAAEQILKTANLRKGVCLLIGFSDGTLAGALHDGGVRHVHGVSSDKTEVEAARGYIQKQGTYGQVAFDYSELKSLPYADGIGNIVVVEDFERLQARGLTIDEIARVLAPYGTLFIKAFAGTIPETEKSICGPWTAYTKKLPQGADEWTHIEHDPERTSVSKDMLAEPPTGIRWLAGLYYPYSTGLELDVGFVSTAGRNFYWYWAHNPVRYGQLKQGSRIVCRDAFNGCLLWEKETPRIVWGADFVGVNHRLYVHLGGPGGLTALDAATGREVFRFKESRDHEYSEILLKNGILLQCANGIQAFDADEGTKLWEKPNGLMAPSMILCGEDSLYYLFQEAAGKTPLFLVCCDLKTGKENWRTEQEMEIRLSYKQGAAGYLRAPRGVSLISFYQGMIFMGNAPRAQFASELGALYAVSAKDGRLLWEYQYDVVGHKAAPSDVFPIGDNVWVKTKNPGKTSDGIYVALDLKTGKETKTIKVGYNRCFPDRAMTRYLLTGDFDFVDIATGKTHILNAARGFCNTGFMVAHGLTYAFPNRCTCFNLVRGFLGLSSGSVPGPAEKRTPVLRKGPAYGASTPHSAKNTDWPVFRHDSNRSNSTSVKLLSDLRPLWRAEIGDVLSSPTVAEGMVFVASIDDHRVVALDSVTGAMKWSFTTGGRVDSPPTIYRGLALFGSADGWVYALRASDGQLAWKLRAAPLERRIMVRGQLESLWPVPGSVLVSDDTLHFAAGRNTYTDGGLYYYAVDPATGQIKWKEHAGSEWGESNNDIMVRGDKSIHLGHRVHFDPSNGTIAKDGGGDKVLYAPFGLLVDCLAYACHGADTLRKQWTYGKVRIKSEPQEAVLYKKKSAVIAVENGTVYGVTESFDKNDYRGKRLWARLLEIHCTPEGDGKGWSVNLDPEIGWWRTSQGWKAASKDAQKVRRTNNSLRMRALVCTADALIFAVQPEGKKEGQLWFVSKADGKTLKTIPVDSVPRWDGMAVADRKLYVVTEDGKVLCYGE